jgi:hypothetical protein
VAPAAGPLRENSTDAESHGTQRNGGLAALGSEEVT